MLVRELRSAEYGLALKLAWRAFEQFEAPEYSAEGVENFRSTINDPDFSRRIRCYGAYDGQKLVGMIATRNEGTHITLFFVDEAYHRQGIGRRLFEAVLAKVPSACITVNSSPYAVEVYRRMGFAATKPEQLTDGIRYTPMIYDHVGRE